MNKHVAADLVAATVWALAAIPLFIYAGSIGWVALTTALFYVGWAVKDWRS